MTRLLSVEGRGSRPRLLTPNLNPNQVEAPDPDYRMDGDKVVCVVLTESTELSLVQKALEEGGCVVTQ